MLSPEEKKKLEQIRKLSELLDTRFEGPFGIRIGLDGILGFVPFVGDIVTTLLSFSILVSAAQLGATPSTLLRMSLNILFENIVDMIPILGSFFDIYWKSNIMNLRILEAQMENPQKVSLSSRIIILALVFLVFVVLFLMAYLSWMIIQFFIGLIS